MQGNEDSSFVIIHPINPSIYEEALNDKLQAQVELELCANIITCVKCPKKLNCRFAYDRSNLFGDCVADRLQM